MQYFAASGDTVLNAMSDYSLLSTYATRKADGSLALLVINKNSSTNLNAQITLTNFAPWSNGHRAFVWDRAGRGHPHQLPSFPSQDIRHQPFPSAGTNFTATFPPYSLTLVTFAPAAAQIAVFVTPAGQLILQVQGQPGVPYVIQTSADLVNWTPVSTNLLTDNVLTPSLIPTILARRLVAVKYLARRSGKACEQVHPHVDLWRDFWR